MSQANQQPVPDEQDRSPSQAETVELLQATVRRLEGVLEQLRTEPQAQLPPLTSIQSLATSTEELAASLTKVEPVAPPVEEEIEVSEPEAAEPSPVPQEAIAPQTIPNEPKPPLVEETQAPVVPEPPPEPKPPAPTPKPKLTDRVLPSFARLEAWWEGVLRIVRSVLPASLREKLSNGALTGILTGTLVAVLLVSVLLLPEPSQPEIGKAKPQEPLPSIKTPPQLEAPGKEQPIVISPAPVPSLELTPEQSLIAAIQSQVDQVTNQYAEGLIQSIEANFTGSRLIVQVGSDWYDLEDSRQSQLANEMLRRSQEVDFRKLELIDPQGTLLARSPVVGQEMVILQRHR